MVTDDENLGIEIIISDDSIIHRVEMPEDFAVLPEIPFTPISDIAATTVEKKINMRVKVHAVMPESSTEGRNGSYAVRNIVLKDDSPNKVKRFNYNHFIKIVYSIYNFRFV